MYSIPRQSDWSSMTSFRKDNDMKGAMIERRLILVDEIREVVLDGGAMRRMETDAQLRKDRELLSNLESSLGEHQKIWHRQPRKPGSSLWGNDSSHQFGGHDILTQTLEIVFALGSAGIV